jgi:hypothetical protein
MQRDDVADTLGIYQVMAKYSYHWDQADVDELVELFAPECHADYPAVTCDGRQEVRAYAESYFAGETNIKDSFHVTANPWVEIEESGERATGRWHFLGAYELDSVGAAWIMGFYENAFAKHDAEWVIDDLSFSPKYVSPYDAGWVNEPFPQRE